MQAFGTQRSDKMNARAFVIGSLGMSRAGGGGWWEEQDRLQVRPILLAYS